MRPEEVNELGETVAGGAVCRLTALPLEAAGAEWPLPYGNASSTAPSLPIGLCYSEPESTGLKTEGRNCQEAESTWKQPPPPPAHPRKSAC